MANRELMGLVTVALLAPVCAYAITFDDGLVHVIDASNSFPDEVITVSADADGSLTTVRVVDGGIARDIHIDAAGIVSVEGGRVTGTVSSEQVGDQQVLISGGEITNVGSNPDNAGTYVMTGGTVTGRFWVGEPGQSAEISGGSINELHLNGGADGGGKLVIRGGTIGRVTSGNDQPAVAILGGEFLGPAQFGVGPGSIIDLAIDDGVFLDDVLITEAIATISGGSFLGDELALTDAWTWISGGQLEASLNLIAGTTTIEGSSFNYPFGLVSDSSGVLTGVLADGMPINTSFVQPDPSLFLVPEPSTALMICSGLLGLGLGCRRSGRPDTGCD